MKEVVFCGSSENKYILDQVIKEKPYDDLSGMRSIDEVMDALLKTEYVFCVIDLDYYPIDAIEMREKLARLKGVCTAQIICFAVGYELNSPLLKNLRSIGLEYFVTNGTIGERKTQLQECLDGKTSVEQLSRAEKAGLTTTEQEKKESKVKSIGFIGTQSRIGTTTQAIQFAKYLQFLGFDVCYIEANDNGHVRLIPELYTVDDQDDALCMIRYKSLDMYYNRFKISEIKQKQYDVYLFDFGALEDEKLFSFLEKDIKIVVGGTKPWEIGHSINALGSLERQDIQYIFSFTENALRSEFKASMGKYAEHTYFAEAVFNMFSLNSNDEAMHKNILKSIGHGKNERKKGGLFGRLRK